MIQLYKNIKNLRQEMGMSQDDLAKQMGYTDRSMIAKIESGKVDLSQSKIIQFAKVFGVLPGDLMGWDDESTQLDLSSTETKIVQAYRKASPDIKAAACAVLGVKGEQESEKEDYIVG